MTRPLQLEACGVPAVREVDADPEPLRPDEAASLPPDGQPAPVGVVLAPLPLEILATPLDDPPNVAFLKLGHVDHVAPGMLGGGEGQGEAPRRRLLAHSSLASSFLMILPRCT